MVKLRTDTYENIFCRLWNPPALILAVGRRQKESRDSALKGRLLQFFSILRCSMMPQARGGHLSVLQKWILIAFNCVFIREEDHDAHVFLRGGTEKGKETFGIQGRAWVGWGLEEGKGLGGTPGVMLKLLLSLWFYKNWLRSTKLITDHYMKGRGCKHILRTSLTASAT